MPREILNINSYQTELAAVKEKVRRIPVCLIIPPSPFLADERVFPFLGPIKVAAELRKNGNPVDVLDLSGFSNYKDIVHEYVKSSEVKVFGLTATSPQFPNAVEIRQTIKKVNPDSVVILGGPHVTLTQTAALEDVRVKRLGRGTHAFNQITNYFDRVVVGDGEMSIFQAINPDPREQVVDAGSRKSPLYIQRGQLDNFEYPARNLIDLASYKYYIDGYRSFSVIAQLGCPFECGFCGGRLSPVFRTARSRGIESVMDEIETTMEYGKSIGVDYRGVMFYDDELNVLPDNLEELCKRLIDLQNKLGLEMRFRGFVKAELFTPLQAKLMYKAGFRILLSGVESGSDEILKTMRKHTTREINAKCVEFAHGAGLKFKALMSIGHPGESEETVRASIDWALKHLRPGDDIDWTIITQYPGSPYFDRSEFIKEKGAWLYTEPVTENELWSREVDFSTNAEYYKGVPGSYTAFVWTKELSAQRLVELRDHAEQVTRRMLGLPLIAFANVQQFEHSMGQGRLPQNILKRSYQD
ncbi:B12-binding domain-containing radical SAM protein [Candidatus Woesebacteria bacterium]|nr:B12-binding domain-containing radical SAM protein [Candidatus Woesebacteria bacterium]